MIRAVLFDVDGVLLESDDALVQAFQHTFKKFGLRPPGREEVLRHVGKTGRQWVRALLPAHSHRLVPEVGEYLVRAYAERFLPAAGERMPFAREALEELRARGVRTAVITNMKRWVLDSFLRRFKLEGLFDVLVSGEEVASPKPAGLPLRVALGQLRVPASQAVFVGDTEVDVRAGRHAGVRVVLLDHERNRALSGAWRRIGSLAELPSIAEVGG